MKTRFGIRLMSAALAALFVLTATPVLAATWKGATTITALDTRSGETYTSTEADENALLLNVADKITINTPTVTKSGNTLSVSDSDNYGINSAVMAKGGSYGIINNGTITTSAKGANGVYSYGGNGGQEGAAGDETTVRITGTTIKTTGNNAGGIMTGGGGITVAKNLKVTTSGTDSSPVRCGRGGGKVTLDGGSYTSGGTGSPAIYADADVTANDATLSSSVSEAIVLDNSASVTLTNCTVTGNNTKLSGKANTYDNIRFYQQTGGAVAFSTLTVTGGTLTCKSGNMFRVTNTNAEIFLTNVKLVNSPTGVLLNASAGPWGISGSNGGNVTLHAVKQTLGGTISVDKASTLSLMLSDSSTFTGKINPAGKAGNVNVEIPAGCTWKLTGNSYITSITSGEGSINLNGYKLYVNGNAYIEEKEDNSVSYPEAPKTVSKIDASLLTATLKKDALTYTGSAQRPVLTVTSPSGKKLTESDYLLTYSKGRRNPGRYSVKITFVGEYTGTKTLYFTIVPKKTSISKLTAKKKSFVVSWKKNTEQTTGYEIQYATNKAFTKGKKTVKIKKNKTVSKTVKKLKGGKKYYVRIRTYKTVSGKKYYSDWSKAKTVKVKK